MFHDYRDPLFWIHINADYPLNFKGILYFPRLDNEYESIEGQVKLYYNQVFVADNIKEVIPEYLLMLKGVLDCPELPLNVSRSYLQNNTYVSKVSAHIVKKVCDKLNSLCNTDRENYESVWDSIKTFVEYACMRDRKFYDRAKDAILLTLTDGSHVTVEQYAEKAKADGHVAPAEEGKDPVVTVYYTTDRELQAQYIALFEAQGIQIAVLDKLIDTQFVQMLESYDATVKFTLFGYCFKSFRDNCINVVIYISQCIHCSHVYTSIPSVAVVHDMPYLVRKIGGGIYHPRTYHSNEVCFNLEINIVSVRIIFPMSRCRWHNTV